MENYIEGRNAVLEAYRSGKTIDKLYVLDIACGVGTSTIQIAKYFKNDKINFCEGLFVMQFYPSFSPSLYFLYHFSNNYSLFLLMCIFCRTFVGKIANHKLLTIKYLS